VIEGRKQSELETLWRGIRGLEFTNKNLQIHCSTSVLLIRELVGKTGTTQWRSRQDSGSDVEIGESVWFHVLSLADG